MVRSLFIFNSRVIPLRVQEHQIAFNFALRVQSSYGRSIAKFIRSIIGQELLCCVQQGVSSKFK